MAGFVLDTSVAVSWLLPDESSGESKAWLERLVVEGGLVPNLWPLEVGNALLMAQRRQRVKAVQALMDLPIERDQETSERAWRETLQLADDHGLTLYDAAYLELAVRLDLPLATFDQPLKIAAQRFGLAVSPLAS
jgi:predicted nucleic acid-binding protein